MCRSRAQRGATGDPAQHVAFCDSVERRDLKSEERSPEIEGYLRARNEVTKRAR